MRRAEPSDFLLCLYQILSQIALGGSKPPRSVDRPVSASRITTAAQKTCLEPSGHRSQRVVWNGSLPVSIWAQS